MLERFVKDAQAVAAGAADEARTLGAPAVEAEHVLLALTRAGGAAGEALAAAGLGHAEVRAALEAETEASLAAVGVALSAFALPDPVPTAGTPRFGATSKAALERALEAARDRGDRRIEPAHILLGVLRAQAGTVPRALERAGTPPQELREAVEIALARR